jgi:hypothetical protein
MSVMAGRPSITSDYLSVILQAIEKAQNNPAQLRSLIYDLARLSLGKHVLTNYHRFGSDGLQQHVRDLEVAINQAESLSQKSDVDSKFEDSLLVARPVEPPEAAAITVRDSFGDSIFADSWTKHELVPSQRALAETYRKARPLTEILRPVEIWEPAFGRAAKRTRPDFWWGVQLASAAVIGVAIYAVILVRSDIFSPVGNYSLATVPQSVAVASTGPAVLPVGVAPPKAHQSLGFPLPSVYGVYAISAGKLYELDQLAIRVPDPRVRISAMISDSSHVTVPNGGVNFIVFRRDLAASAPIDVFVRVVAQVQRDMKFSGDGPPTITKIDGPWAVRSKSYEYRVAPVDDKPEMIVLHAAESDLVLAPGRYVLVLGGQGYDFMVAGEVTDTAHCLERSNVVGGTVYSECPAPFSSSSSIN